MVKEMSYVRYSRDAQQVNSTLGSNFSVVPAVTPGTPHIASSESDQHQDLALERQEVLLSKLLKRIEDVEKSSTAREVRRLTARVERLERGIGVPRVEALEKRVKDLELVLGSGLTDVVDEVASLVAAMAECKGAQTTLERDVSDVQQSVATDISAILTTLVTVAQQLVDHNVHHGKHYQVLNGAFAGAAGSL